MSVRWCEVRGWHAHPRELARMRDPWSPLSVFMNEVLNRFTIFLEGSLMFSKLRFGPYF